MAGGYGPFEMKVGSKWGHPQGPLRKSLRLEKSICLLAGGSVSPVFRNGHKQEPPGEPVLVGLCPLFP